MIKYRKKSETIEAVQFLNSADIHEFVKDRAREPIGKDYMEIETHRGVLKVERKDWVIMDERGDFYVCKPDVFERTYELVEERHVPNPARRKCRIIERIDVDGKISYVIQQKHVIFWWWWVDAWVNNMKIRVGTDYQCIFSTLEEAKKYVCYFDGRKNTERVIQTF